MGQIGIVSHLIRLNENIILFCNSLAKNRNGVLSRPTHIEKYSTTGMSRSSRNVKVMKVKRTKSYPRLKQTRGTWQLGTIWDPGVVVLLQRTTGTRFKRISGQRLFLCISTLVTFHLSSISSNFLKSQFRSIKKYVFPKLQLSPVISLCAFIGS